MNNLGQFTIDLLNWYTQRARPFLCDLLPSEKLAEFDKDGKQLQDRLSTLDKELVVCFLGSSGVGKSTLLNAIVDGTQPLVPSGGIGPLTAQAVVVRYAPQPKLEVEYHSIRMLHQTYFGLEQMYRVDLGTPVSDEVYETLAEGLDETDLPETSNVISERSDSEEFEKTGEREENRKQWKRRAQLLVTGSQDHERTPGYLIDSLREVVGKPRRWGTTARTEDERQLGGIREVVNLVRSQMNKRVITYDAQDQQAFKQKVQDHAAGFMAPLIKNLTIHWPSTTLQYGLTLVDLPGIGISGDVHKDVTRKWIRDKKVKALVLVVDHRGITDAVGQALRQSEFLNALLYSADEPDADPVLIVAVTRIDDTAGDSYRNDPGKRKFQHFLDISKEVHERMRNDLKNLLNHLWLQTTEVTEARQQVAHHLLDTLQVYPISAPEYNRILVPSDDEHPFLRDIEQTGIPSFVRNLSQLASQRTENLSNRLNAQTELFRDGLSAQLQIIEAQWEEQVQARGEAEKLRGELELFLQPRREELLRRQGAFREFLATGVPQRIKDQVSIASNVASRSIEKYMVNLGAAHWGTLRASVRRGGRYQGASDINLPTEFALRFEEPIADAWSKEILRDVRTHTRDYGSDCLSLADELVDWAESQGKRVQVRGAKAQYEALQANTKKFEAVGREMASGMRDKARANLVEAIEKKIQQACKDFVAKNQDIGRGVKVRIMELYKELAQEVASIAEAPARTLLQEVYREAENEIRAAFVDFQDPLTPIATAIVATETQRIERTDVRRRENIITDLRAISADLPVLSGDLSQN